MFWSGFVGVRGYNVLTKACKSALNKGEQLHVFGRLVNDLLKGTSKTRQQLYFKAKLVEMKILWKNKPNCNITTSKHM